MRGTEVVEWDILLLVDLVVDHRVVLGERTALDILAGYTNVDVLKSQRAKGEHLGSRPVDGGALLDGLAVRGEDAGQVTMGRKASGVVLPIRSSAPSSAPVGRVGRVRSASCLGKGNPCQAADSHSLLVGT